MTFAEVLGLPEALRRVKIYATDLDEGALAIARRAVYDARHLEPLEPELRSRYFEPAGERLAFRPDLRRLVIFGRHNLLQDAPISRLDLLSCRNTLMYLNADAQAQILERFFFGLNEGGYLLLGKAESMLAGHTAVQPVQSRLRLFQKAPQASFRSRVLQSLANGNANEGGEPPADRSRISQNVFETDQVAQVIVDPQGTLALVNQQARQLFGLLPSDIGRPFQDLEFSYRPIELRSLIERTLADVRPVTVEDVALPLPGGERRWFSVCVMPLLDAREVIAARVVFTDITVTTHLRAELERSKGELETAYEELQSSNEELETTNEELQSAIEELETTNEELQSTNEELETLNEELQSTNEELGALNHGLHDQADELNAANDFLESILRSLLSAVIVVDKELRVEVWNRQAEEQWGLRADEAQGRHLLNLDIGLPLEKVFHAVRQCLTDPNESQTLGIEATNRRGRAVNCTVVVTPRRRGGEVAGAILVVNADAAAE
jgi:two-component system CheB/CheR fusion protein